MTCPAEILTDLLNGELDEPKVKASGINEEADEEIPVRLNRKNDLKKIYKNLSGSENSLWRQGMLAAERKRYYKSLIDTFKRHKWDIERVSRVQDEFYQSLVKHHLYSRNNNREGLLEGSAKEEMIEEEIDKLEDTKRLVICDIIFWLLTF